MTLLSHTSAIDPVMWIEYPAVKVLRDLLDEALQDQVLIKDSAILCFHPGLGLAIECSWGYWASHSSQPPTSYDPEMESEFFLQLSCMA